MASSSEKAGAALKHLGMLYGKSELLRTNSWLLVQRLAMGRATKAEVMALLVEQRDLWQRIYEAGATMLPADVAPTPQEKAEPSPPDEEVDW